MRNKQSELLPLVDKPIKKSDESKPGQEARESLADKILRDIVEEVLAEKGEKPKIDNSFYARIIYNYNLKKGITYPRNAEIQFKEDYDDLVKKIKALLEDLRIDYKKTDSKNENTVEVTELSDETVKSGHKRKSISIPKKVFIEESLNENDK